MYEAYARGIIYNSSYSIGRLRRRRDARVADVQIAKLYFQMCARFYFSIDLNLNLNILKIILQNINFFYFFKIWFKISLKMI